MRLRQTVLSCTVLIAACLAVSGCNKSEPGTAPGSEPTIEEKISKIENDPTIPAPAKAGAIQALRQQQTAAAARGQASGAAQASAAAARGQAPK
jgi:hypothetical protein